ncbi:O-acetylhomoserine aminocarboxypropyltransferase/cysteine synthase family protein [Leucobacter chromiireducens]|uniref:O-acetylhomoserine aminocarboxypropyltransferase/cysteine synthase n=1 Tax=Leucobacter chromiireducens subsp. solipictus TaxID=398235 RepID=A0ABS1SH73_9MICO|nr:PLP-dependent transferase [Leucobacter chromiireducens]MBL3679672.1 O-acetylhomoserine aminocarboxypropyltransferase/cysteine synthase [Leucobacter chromiireducens subsp. solipictus]
MNAAPTPATPVTDWAGFDFDTRQVHAGEYVDRNAGLRIPPIALSAGYVFDSFDDQVDRFAGRALWRGGVGLTRGTDAVPDIVDELAPGEPAPIYSRQGNPTNAVAEDRLASLEGGTAAVAVSSGQAAISSALFALAGQGDHIVSTASIYGGTRILFGRSFKRFGIGIDYVWDADDDAEWDRAIRPTTKAIYTETIPNPRNDVTDLRRIAAVAARHNLPLVVDNTVGTPALIRPFEHGANIVVHSTTKFLTGHGAAVGGAIVDGGTFDWEAAERAGRSFPLITAAPRPGLGSLLDRFGPIAYSRAVREAVVNDIGPALSPFTGFLLHQGMETLSLRMDRHVASSQRIAAWLEQQPEVESVDYAGLPSNPLFGIAERDYAGRTGSVFGVTVRGGIDGARSCVDGLRVFSRMTGIGDTRSMVIHPLSSTHATFAPEITERLGITPGLLRLSVGLESADDLIRDLRTALDRV